MTAPRPLTGALDVRLVVPAASAWLVAGVLIGVPRSLLADVAPLAAAILFALALSSISLALFRLRSQRSERAGQRPRRLTRPSGAEFRRPVSAVLCVVATTCAAAGLIAGCVAAQLPARDPADLGSLLAHTLTVRLTVSSLSTDSPATGFPSSDPTTPGNSQVRFTATATSIASGPTVITARMPVLVFLRGASFSRRAQLGDQLQLKGRLRPADPGESVTYLFYAEAAQTPGTPHSDPPYTGADTHSGPAALPGAGDADPGFVESAPWYLGWANRLREAFRDSAAALPGDGAQLVPGLAIGDVSLVGDELKDEMIASGLSHLTAVSGANCAIVVAAIMLLGGALSLSRRWRVALSIVVMTAFVVLVTPSSSVLRAAVMATIVLVTLASGRAPKGLPALGLATIVLLACDPWLARNYGLALSVLATAGLLVLTRPLQHALARWMPGWLSLVVAVPLAAQLACQPVLVLLSPTISTYSVVANLLAEPAAPLATVVGLVSCVVGAVFPALAPVGAWLTWVPASWIAGVARFFATAPGATLPWPAGGAGVLLVVILTACALVVLLLRSSRQPALSTPSPPASPQPPAPAPLPATPARARRRPPTGRAVVRTIAAALLLVMAAGYLGTAVGTTVLATASWPATWEIAACDIGQGDAVVLHSHPAGDRDYYALVDVGPEAELLTTCLNRLAIERIDLLVLTHYDLDHVGGLGAVIGRVSTVLMGPPEDARDERMAGALRNGGADVRQARRGDSGTVGDVGWSILWPQPQTTLRGNDASVTVQFDGAFRSLFLGDLGEDAQRQVSRANVLADEDVVKVAHHGSADQSEPLYQAVRAEVGLVSVGANNRYGHPTARLLGILARTGTAAYRTDLLGMIVLAPSAGGIDVWSEGQARVESRTR